MHKHDECKHKIKYCKVCDVAYCKNCFKEWGRTASWTYSYTPIDSITWTDSGTAPYDITTSADSVYNHIHEITGQVAESMGVRG